MNPAGREDVAQLALGMSYDVGEFVSAKPLIKSFFFFPNLGKDEVHDVACMAIRHAELSLLEAVCGRADTLCWVGFTWSQILPQLATTP